MSVGNSVVPDDVLQLENNNFFEFVKLFAGEKLSNVIKFQDISNTQCLLACEDPFEILLLDSDDLVDLQKQACVKLKSSGFVVLPGLICKMKILKGALINKRTELKRRRIISDNVNRTSGTLSNSSVINNGNNLTQLSVQESNIYSSSTATSYATEDKLKQHLVNLVDDWCEKFSQNKNQLAFRLQHDLDYLIIVDLVSNKALVKCRCGVKSMLGQKDSRYILSNFIRHLTHKNPCVMVKEKLASINANVNINNVSDGNDTNESVDVESNSMSDLVSRAPSSLGKRRKDQTVNSSSSKKKRSI
ncbi:unnamed protein product [Adineta ricciae]|uniref:Uncharacterized protein n=1 Tax=Adineta ricciae TaxID=249248 RepID=A0A814SH44_ADIRI|nr:unnamed protein product [Adineta ricciae]